MLPISLDEAEVASEPSYFCQLENGQRFVDVAGVIYEKIIAGEAWIVTGEQAGEFVYPSPNMLVKKITLKEQ